MEDRFNTPHTSAIEIDLLGHKLLISQDPNSKHLGTTVWDSSLVFAKFLERNSKKGEFSRIKLSGKRVIELGAGCGLAGLSMALLGCNVVVTDQVAVIPLLMRNVERNLSRAKYAASDQSYLGPVGDVAVAELDWGNEAHVAAVEPPFDYIIGTDVVYVEHLLEPLITTILSLAGPKSTVVLGYEFRSSGVREKLQELCQNYFHVKKVPHAKMHSQYQHPNIDLFILRQIATLTSNVCQTEEYAASSCQADEAGNANSQAEKQEPESSKILDQEEEGGLSTSEEKEGLNDGESRLSNIETNGVTCLRIIGASDLSRGHSRYHASEWEVRRLGSAAAQLLSGISPPSN